MWSLGQPILITLTKMIIIRSSWVNGTFEVIGNGYCDHIDKLSC